MRQPTDSSVGIVGLGLVGSALAEHLLHRGFRVVGHDLEPSKQAWLEAAGGTAVDSPTEVAAHASRVILSLLTTAIAETVVEGEFGLMAGEATPSHIVDTTTGDPDQVLALATRLSTRGVCYLDATISGSSLQIRNRQALLMVGGDHAAVEGCYDLLDAISDHWVYVGPRGHGSKAKLATNLVLGLNRLALAEGLVFAECLGLDPDQFLDLLRHSPAYSVAVDVKGEKMIRGDFAPESRLVQHLKDVGIIVDHASRAGLNLPLSACHQRLLQQLVDEGDGELDTAAVIRALRPGSGTQR